MKWYKNLYIGEKASKRKKTIIARCKIGKPQLGTYLITLPVNDSNSLEIYPSYVLLQEHYKKKNMFVVGIALEREEALEVVQKILMDCYDRTGQFLVREMVLNQLG